MKNHWNQRYSEASFAYGKTPNVFLENTLKDIPAGKILFPAEGEGRNAVFAARLNWEVYAFDQSDQGKKKAELLASENHVKINYQICDFKNYPFENGRFDAAALIYAHITGSEKQAFHMAIDSSLKIGGIIIFEAFSKNHLEYNHKNPGVGGPKDVDMLYSKEEILTFHPNYKIIQLEEVEIELNEGNYHNGLASVLRFRGEKVS